MGAARIIETLKASGLELAVVGENLVVSPRSAITPALRQLILRNKTLILDELSTDDRKRCMTCRNLDGRRCRARGVLVLDDLPRRCFSYRPQESDPDQRSGAERWPSLRPEGPR